MEIIKVSDYDQLSCKAADLIARQIQHKPDSVLGLATGATPKGTYAELVSMYEKGALDFKNVVTFNLDEYKGIDKHHRQSYAFYMEQNLFSKINIQKQNTFIPDGSLSAASEACAQYEEKLAAHAPIDLQILGIGHNGHIGFNEPGTYFENHVHCVSLSKQTIQANAKYFGNEKMPTQAYTVGIKNIMQARKILLLVSGEDKARVLKECIYGKITPQVPGSILQLHPDVTILADTSAICEM